MSSRFFGSALFCFSAILMGCGGGSQTATVSGVITYKGKPVYTGTISIMGAKGESAAGGIAEDGSYTILNAPTGVVRIAVSSPKPSVPAIPPKRLPGEPVAPALDVSKWFPIDAKYENIDTSGKEMAISGGTNNLNIALE